MVAARHVATAVEKAIAIHPRSQRMTAGPRQLGAQPSGSADASIYRRLTVSDCLHCDINELIRGRLEQSEMIDIPDLAGKNGEELG